MMNHQSVLAHVFPELMNSNKQLSLNDVNLFLDMKIKEFVSDQDLKVVDIKPLQYGRIGPDHAKLRGKIKGHVNIDDDLLSIIGINEFNSVRSDVCVYAGQWMYEVILGSKGVMQLGWCTEQCKFNEENGVGDTPNSYGFDGNRIKLWNVRSRSYGESWEIGDVITCCIDLTETKLEYYRNGKSMGIGYDKITVGPGIVYYPAVSLSQGDSITVNFGNSKFKYFVEGYKPIQHQNQESLAKCNCLVNYWERLIPIAADVIKISVIGDNISTSNDQSDSMTNIINPPNVAETNNFSIQSCCWLIASNLLSRLENFFKQPYLSDTCLIPFVLKFCDTTNLSSRQSHVSLILDMIWSLYERESAKCIIENLISGIVSLYEITTLDSTLKSQNKYLHLILALVKHQTTKFFILEHSLFGRLKLPLIMHLKIPDDSVLNQLVIGEYWNYPVCMPDQCYQHRSIAHISLRPEFTDNKLKTQFFECVHKIQVNLRELEDIQTEILYQLTLNDGESDTIFRTMFLQHLFRFLRCHLNNVEYVSRYTTSMLISLFHRLISLIRLMWKNLGNKYTELPQFEDISVPIIMYAMPNNYLLQLNSPRIGGRFNQLSKTFKSDIDLLLNNSCSSSGSVTDPDRPVVNKKQSTKRRFMNFKRHSDFSKFLTDSKIKKNKPINIMLDIILEEKNMSLSNPLSISAPINNKVKTHSPSKQSSSSGNSNSSTVNSTTTLTSALNDNNASFNNNSNSTTNTSQSVIFAGNSSNSTTNTSNNSGFTFLPSRVEPLSLYTGLLGHGSSSSASALLRSSSTITSGNSVAGVVGGSGVVSGTGGGGLVDSTMINFGDNEALFYSLSSSSTNIEQVLEGVLGELTSILQLSEGANILYHIGANDHYAKVATIRNKAHSLIIAIIDLSDKLNRAPEEEIYLKTILNQSLKTLEKKLNNITQKLAFYFATELSEEKRDDILWLWTTIISTMEDGKSDKLYSFIPTYHLENVMNIFRHITQIFHPTLHLEGLRDCSTVLGLHGQLLLNAYRDKRITQNNLRSPIVKAISEMLQLPLSLRYLEQKLSLSVASSSPLSTNSIKDISHDVTAFLMYLVNDWTDSMIILNKFWKGDGFAYRYQELPHQQLPEFHLRDAVAKVMEKPNPSKFFQNHLKIVLKDNTSICTSFIDMILNKVNWSFSEVVSNMQELNQHRDMRMDRLADIRYIRTCSLCFDITISLLRILEMIVTLVPEAFVDTSRSNSELFLNRLFSSISQIFNRCLNKGLFHNIINVKINGLDQIDYFPIVAASLGVLLSLILDSPKKFQKTSSKKLVEVMIRESNFMQQTLDKISVHRDADDFSKSPTDVDQSTTTEDYLSTVMDISKYPNYINPVEVQRVRILLDLIKRESNSLAASTAFEKDEDLCTICYAHPKNTMFKPCNHSTCKNCITYQMMTNPICFFCKSEIKKVEDLSGKDLHIKPNKNANSNNNSRFSDD